tara:strand:+ start:502 stop:1065 length:564 start_codon:yes stop_codon:yes gene_type:complete
MSGSDLTVIHKPKVPMAFAASAMAELCQRLDDGEAPNEALVLAFKDTELELGGAVDRRIVFMSMIESAIEDAKKARDAWSDQAKKLSKAYEAFEANTIGIIESHPDLPFKGDLGKLTVRKNPPSVVTAFGDRDLTPSEIYANAIDSGFVRTKTTYRLDKDAIKDALKSGAVLEWAKLEQGQALKVKK